MTMAELWSMFKLNQNNFVLNTIRSPLIQSFPFNLLIRQLVQEHNKNLLLILFSENLQHYSAVSAKCGFNLKKYVDDGSIRIFDSFDGDFVTDTICFDYENFNSNIDRLIESLPANSTVLIDSLDVLHSLGLSSYQIYSFVRKLRYHLQKNSCGLFIETSYKPENNNEWNSLITSLIYSCDVWVDCDKPKTGYSLTINGILKLKYKNSDQTTEYNYRLSKRSVILMQNSNRIL